MKQLAPIAIVVLLVAQALWGQQEVHVAQGQSLQTAIRDAAPGAVIVLEEGDYAGPIEIDKPLTLRGAGWDKTVIRAGEAAQRTDREKIELVDQLEAVPSLQEQIRLVVQFFRTRPAITVRGAQDVTITGVKVTGRAPGDVERMTDETLVLLDGAKVQISDCAVLGPFMNGITITNGADASIRKTLVAAIWNVGIAVHGRSGGRAGKLHLSDSDVRNCYHRGITIASDEVTIENCRISGSAWHGIRYDHVSPTIRRNHIFGNARSGIYASGTTAATVKGNVFWRNEMGGMSCWFGNRDTIEGNTFVGNLREGLAVLGASQPRVVRNLFVENPVAVVCSPIGGEGPGTAMAEPPVLEHNHLWNNDKGFAIADEPRPLPEGNEMLDPKLAAAERNFALPAESPARQAKVGAADPIALASPWPIQPEEKQIIPDGQTRDYRHWKKPKGVN